LLLLNLYAINPENIFQKKSGKKTKNIEEPLSVVISRNHPTPSMALWTDSKLAQRHCPDQLGLVLERQSTKQHKTTLGCIYMN